jgi:hypothetical protein
MSLFDIIEKIFEKELELGYVHKLLHVSSKILLYLSMAILYQLIIPEIPVNGTFYALLTLILIILSIGLSYYVEYNFIRNNYKRLFSLNMIEISEILSNADNINVYDFEKNLMDASSKIFIRKISEILRKSGGKTFLLKIIFGNFMIITSLINNLILMPIATLYLFKAIGWDMPISISSHSFLLTPIMILLIAFLFSYINISIIIPSFKSYDVPRDKKDDIKKVDIKGEKIIQAIIYMTLLRIGRSVEFGLSRWEKILLSMTLFLLANPWDLLYSPASNVRSGFIPSFKKMVLVIMPSANLLLPKTQKYNGSEKELSRENKLSKIIVEICKHIHSNIELDDKTKVNENRDNNINDSEKFTSCIYIDFYLYELIKDETGKRWQEKCESIKCRLAYENTIKLAVNDALKRIKTTVQHLFRDWLIEYIDYEDVNESILNPDIIKILFEKYSIVDTDLTIANNSKNIQKLLSLYQDFSLINSINNLSSKFTFLMPITFVMSYTVPISLTMLEQKVEIDEGQDKKQKDSSKRLERISYSVSVNQRIYIIIPVLIAINFLTSSEDIESVISLVKKGKQYTSTAH